MFFNTLMTEGPGSLQNIPKGFLVPTVQRLNRETPCFRQKNGVFKKALQKIFCLVNIPGHLPVLATVGAVSELVR